MNKLLIDSHIFIWLLHNPKKIGQSTLSLIEEADVVLLSQASIFELAVKYKKGKLRISLNEILQGVKDLGVGKLQIKDEHLLCLSENSVPNKDPFDGLLMAQAMYEGIILLTADKELLSSKMKYVRDARL